MTWLSDSGCELSTKGALWVRGETEWTWHWARGQLRGWGGQVTISAIYIAVTAIYFLFIKVSVLHKSYSWPPGLSEKVSGQGQEAASAQAQQSMKDTLRQLLAAGQAEGQCQKKNSTLENMPIISIGSRIPRKWQMSWLWSCYSQIDGWSWSVMRCWLIILLLFNALDSWF